MACPLRPLFSHTTVSRQALPFLSSAHFSPSLFFSCCEVPCFCGCRGALLSLSLHPAERMLRASAAAPFLPPPSIGAAGDTFDQAQDDEEEAEREDERGKIESGSALSLSPSPFTSFLLLRVKKSPRRISPPLKKRSKRRRRRRREEKPKRHSLTSSSLFLCGGEVTKWSVRTRAAYKGKFWKRDTARCKRKKERKNAVAGASAGGAFGVGAAGARGRLRAALQQDHHVCAGAGGAGASVSAGDQGEVITRLPRFESFFNWRIS